MPICSLELSIFNSSYDGSSSAQGADCASASSRYHSSGLHLVVQSTSENRLRTSWIYHEILLASIATVSSCALRASVFLAHSAIFIAIRFID